MIIECFNATQWLTTLRQRYNLEDTILNDSPNSFTVLISSHRDNKTMLVGRYCRVSHFGIVICRRQDDTKFRYERRNLNASTKKD